MAITDTIKRENNGIKTLPIRETVYNENNIVQAEKITLANVTTFVDNTIGSVNGVEELYFDAIGECADFKEQAREYEHIEPETIEDTGAVYYPVICRYYDTIIDSGDVVLINVKAPQGKKLELCGVFSHGSYGYNNDGVQFYSMGINYEFYEDGVLACTIANPEDEQYETKATWVNTANAFPYMILKASDSVFPSKLLNSSELSDTHYALSWLSWGDVYSQEIMGATTTLSSAHLINMVKLPEKRVCTSFKIVARPMSDTAKTTMPKETTALIAIFKLVDA